MVKQVDDRTRRRLRRRFQEVLDRYRIPTCGGEPAEHAAALWDSAVLARFSDADVALLAEVLAAMRRLRDGQYGRCVACGHTIPRARLDAQPELARCSACVA